MSINQHYFGVRVDISDLVKSLFQQQPNRYYPKGNVNNLSREEYFVKSFCADFARCLHDTYSIMDGFAISTDLMFVLQDLTDWQSVNPNDILSSIQIVVNVQERCQPNKLEVFQKMKTKEREKCVLFIQSLVNDFNKYKQQYITHLLQLNEFGLRFLLKHDDTLADILSTCFARLKTQISKQNYQVWI